MHQPTQWPIAPHSFEMYSSNHTGFDRTFNRINGFKSSEKVIRAIDEFNNQFDQNPTSINESYLNPSSSHQDQVQDLLHITQKLPPTMPVEEHAKAWTALLRSNNVHRYGEEWDFLDAYKEVSSSESPMAMYLGELVCSIRGEKAQEYSALDGTALGGKTPEITPNNYDCAVSRHGLEAARQISPEAGIVYNAMVNLAYGCRYYRQQLKPLQKQTI